MIEGKGLGNKKINRVNISLSNAYERKLKRLSTSTNMKPTTLAGLLIEMSLDNHKLVAQLQDEYCTQIAYRVVTVQDYNSGKVEYFLKGD